MKGQDDCLKASVPALAFQIRRVDSKCSYESRSKGIIIGKLFALLNNSRRKYGNSKELILIDESFCPIKRQLCAGLALLSSLTRISVFSARVQSRTTAVLRENLVKRPFFWFERSVKPFVVGSKSLNMLRKHESSLRTESPKVIYANLILFLYPSSTQH